MPRGRMRRDEVGLGSAVVPAPRSRLWVRAAEPAAQPLLRSCGATLGAATELPWQEGRDGA